MTTLPPRIYDLAQTLLGARVTFARLAPRLADMGDALVLDVGGGTGLYRQLLPKSARYVCLDRDAAKLARARIVSSQLILGDATCIPIASKAMNFVLCIAVAHHLADDALSAALREMARVVRNRLVFLEPVAASGRPVGRLLWSLDAGSHPRTHERLLDELSVSFACTRVESYSIHHRYLLCDAVPRG
jgi:ubiquinone/menaquinone biosynthesis C-methylase UbiE